MLWLLNGKIVADDNGVPINCSRCPCNICDNLVQEGSYYIQLVVDGFEETYQKWEDPEEESVISGETSLDYLSTHAEFSGILPASGFIKSNTNRWLYATPGTVPSGEIYNEHSFYYRGGGSDTYWEKYESNELDVMIDYDREVGQCWLIIHCDEDVGVPLLQVYFAYLIHVVYSDDSGQVIYDTPYTIGFPNNYYNNDFDDNNVYIRKVSGTNKYIVERAVLSRVINEELPNGGHKEVRNRVEVIFSYFPPSNNNNNE